ncbi:hypothetical protein AB0M61_29695 [Streptomyces sp. NPDC051642]|uniref:hypothetical protein n=1 Tax=Streptomyces sp. NPDC051642 TaxID=3154646 RepID=UPI003441B135
MLDQGPAHPGVPAGGLALVEAADALGELEVFLQPAAAAHHIHQIGQGDGEGGVAAVVGEFAGVAVPADQHRGVSVLLAVGGVVGVDVEHGPVVVPVALESVAGAQAHPVLLRDPHGKVGDAQTADGGVHPVVGADGQGVVEAELTGRLPQFTASVVGVRVDVVLARFS